MATGGCFCGAVRYETGQRVFDETLCHCSICRGTTGAPAVVWFTVSGGDFRFIRGQPVHFHSSSVGIRGFCGGCGTQLTFQRTDLPGELDVTSCSLDEPESITPKDHTFTRSQMSWLKLNDGLPRYPAGRD